MEDRLKLKNNITSDGRIQSLWDGFITADSKSSEVSLENKMVIKTLFRFE